jgi:hypothetical protein
MFVIKFFYRLIMFILEFLYRLFLMPYLEREKYFKV